MGRDQKNERRSEHWTKMLRSTMQEPAWRALSPVAQALYPWLKLEWHGEKANNNGRICLSVRQAAKCIGCTLNTAAKAFHDLQAKGFIEVRDLGRLGVDGRGKSTLYELTELAMPGTSVPRKLYRSWRVGEDLPVRRARANNPQGHNRKTKSRLKDRDDAIVDLATKRRGLSHE